MKRAATWVKQLDHALTIDIGVGGDGKDFMGDGMESAQHEVRGIQEKHMPLTRLGFL